MCDERQLERWAKDAISRRAFGVLGATGAAGALAACNSIAGSGMGGPDDTAGAQGVSGRRVFVALAEGTMDGYFTAPATGKHPGVIFWPDIASLRPAKLQMADRLAGEGYAVLVMNPYYRDVTAPRFEDFEDFAANQGFQKVKPWRDKLNAEAIMSDARGAVQWLDAQAQVDTSMGIGTQGYCMGGPFAFWAAAAVPSRVRGVASFHGGGLVRDGDPLSPHNTFDDTSASYLVAISQDDDAEAPTHKDKLRQAAKEAGRPVEVEVYPADHGWTVPDAPAYDRVAAERAYANLLALYRRAL